MLLSRLHSPSSQTSRACGRGSSRSRGRGTGALTGSSCAAGIDAVAAVVRRLVLAATAERHPADVREASAASLPFADGASTSCWRARGALHVRPVAEIAEMGRVARPVAWSRVRGDQRATRARSAVLGRGPLAGSGRGRRVASGYATRGTLEELFAAAACAVEGGVLRATGPTARGGAVTRAGRLARISAAEVRRLRHEGRPVAVTGAHEEATDRPEVGSMAVGRRSRRRLVLRLLFSCSSVVRTRRFRRASVPSRSMAISCAPACGRHIDRCRNRTGRMT